MELECIIAGISQDMSFEENVTTTFLHLRLPDGQQLRVAVDDAAAASVVALSVAQNGQPRTTPRSSLPAPPAPPVRAPVKQEPELDVDDALPQEWDSGTNGIAKAESIPFSEEDGPRIFGGQEEEAPTKYPRGQVQNGPKPVPGSNVQRTASGKVVVPAKTVPKSECGYPMVNSGGRDPETLTSSDNKNEDGVGSV
jgi:hypothetical protein